MPERDVAGALERLRERMEGTGYAGDPIADLALLTEEIAALRDRVAETSESWELVQRMYHEERARAERAEAEREALRRMLRRIMAGAQVDQSHNIPYAFVYEARILLTQPPGADHA